MAGDTHALLPASGVVWLPSRLPPVWMVVTVRLSWGCVWRSCDQVAVRAYGQLLAALMERDPHVVSLANGLVSRANGAGPPHVVSLANGLVSEANGSRVEIECMFRVQMFDFLVRACGDACLTRFCPRGKLPRAERSNTC